MKKIIINNLIRWGKIIAMLIAIFVAISAYQLTPEEIIYYSNGSNIFDLRISFFCTILTLLVTIEYWKDWLLRIISGSTALMCINNYLDELIFNPFTFDENEKVFLGLIIANFIHTIYNQWSNQQKNIIA